MTTTEPAPAPRLPQLAGRPMVTDAGMETDLIFNHGVDLPEFAAFPLLDDAQGRALLRRYYEDFATIAARAGAGLVLESATWRANPDWGARLGCSAADLHRLNVDAVRLLAQLRDRRADAGAGSLDPADVVLCGTVGPRGDGYRPGAAVDAEEARAYHRPQVESFAAAGVDVVTAYTLTDPGEAVGVVLAAREAALPVAISFTVETDGRLPGGTTLADAVRAVDAAAAPDYFLVNCAHPQHVRPAVAPQDDGGDDGGWRERVVGVRYNASPRSHAELDEATELDPGDLDELAAGHAALAPLLPNLSILGGCCGSDARHVARLWGQ